MKWFFLFISIFLVKSINIFYDLHKENILINDFYEITGQTMGTYWRVCLSNIKNNKIQDIKKNIQNSLDKYEDQISTWKKNSLLSQFNQYPGTEKKIINQNILDIVSMAIKIGKKTNGALDITIGQLINFWGFGPEKKNT